MDYSPCRVGYTHQITHYATIIFFFLLSQSEKLCIGCVVNERINISLDASLRRRANEECARRDVAFSKLLALALEAYLGGQRLGLPSEEISHLREQLAVKDRQIAHLQQTVSALLEKPGAKTGVADQRRKTGAA